MLEKFINSNKLEKFSEFKINETDFRKFIGGLQPCQYYENRCMQTAFNNGNTFLLSQCDALCDSSGNWAQQ
jgi:hypothetical protein